jgi:hypothetical protein
VAVRSPGNADGQALPGELIDHGQLGHFEGASVKPYPFSPGRGNTTPGNISGEAAKANAGTCRG